MSTHTPSASAVLLSVVVPSYNSQEYLNRCLDSMLPLPAGVEVIIVNDGSADATSQIAHSYAERYPEAIQVIDKENGGHGSGVNAGLARACGLYFKVCDSDDWFDYQALLQLLAAIKNWGEDLPPDLIVTNYVYEKQGKRHRFVMNYRRVLTDGRIVTWDEIRRFKRDQYLLMHSLCYRTEILRSVNLQLPEHCFYVDNIFAFKPMAAVRTLAYLDIDLYRYFIGRADQSVSEKVMVKRLDQQLRVNTIMIDDMPGDEVELPARLRWYMEHYLGVVTAVSSILSFIDGSSQRLRDKQNLWRRLRAANPHAYWHIRRTLVGNLVNLKGSAGRRFALLVYRVAKRVVGFN